ncbi:MAG TPA: GGDEF domain-containing protein [Pseudonocardiaceae bacterium]|jgi:diguanylate cyclase (GGDEF)-like protein|nr:GGDEF domain-containing protein [Pseudonocardiaceae bacterium]
MGAGQTATAEITDTIWSEVVDELRVGVLLQDELGRVLVGNDVAAGLLGLSAAELVDGTRPDDWLASDDGGAPLPAPADLAGQVLRAGSQLAIPMLISRRGRRDVRLWVTYYPVSHRGRPRMLVVLRPVHTAVGHAQGLLDPLTGLPSRALLLDRLDQALIRARTHGTLATLVLLDVDGMTRINAEFGFQRGDALLTVLAGRLREGLRDDYAVARYGGNRFAVVAEHPGGSGEPIAARVLDLANRSVRLGGHRVGVRARVRWATSDGAVPVHSMITHLESRLARQRQAREV